MTEPTKPYILTPKDRLFLKKCGISPETPCETCHGSGCRDCRQTGVEVKRKTGDT